MIIKIQNDSASTPDPVRMISVAVIVVVVYRWIFILVVLPFN